MPKPPGVAAPAPPAPPRAAPAPPAPRPPDVDAAKDDYEKRLLEMEKRLQEEREKVLLSNLKNQAEAANSAKVELAIKDLQEKVRRDRREQDHEDLRHKLDGRVQELESRLAQERETWVATLKNQMLQRESQEKDLESQLGGRLQEMERRWLEEKAVWQRAATAKDDEIRNLRNLAEKLKGVEVEWSKVSVEKKALETRVTDLMTERAESQVKLGKANEIEKEAVGLRAELSIARQQLGSTQERLERDLQSMRQSAREREDRLTFEIDRLQRELSTLGARLRGEFDVELRRVKEDGASEANRYKEKAEKTASEAARLKAILAALERQAAVTRAQLSHYKKASAEWEKTQEHYKAEFVVLQRRWADREKEIRGEVEENLQRVFSADMDKIRTALEERARKELEAVSEKLRFESREALLAKEKEIVSLCGRLDETFVQKASVEEEKRRALSSLEEEKRVAVSALEEFKKGSRDESERTGGMLRQAQEEVGVLKADLAEVRERFAAAEKAQQEAILAKGELERLSMGQAAEIKNLQDAFFSLRGQLARDAQTAKLFMQEKERLEARIRELEGRAGGQVFGGAAPIVGQPAPKPEPPKAGAGG